MDTYNCPVEDVALFFIAKGQLDHVSTTHLKIQKLIYYAQGFVIACTGLKLFNDVIQAWEYGPVCPRLYQELKKFSSCNLHLLQPEMAIKEFSPTNVVDILCEIWRVFGKYDGWELVEFTHQEKPWMDIMDP